jgi:hypothetical protein
MSVANVLDVGDVLDRDKRSSSGVQCVGIPSRVAVPGYDTVASARPSNCGNILKTFLPSSRVEPGLLHLTEQVSRKGE